jgi:hypothetical protein
LCFTFSAECWFCLTELYRHFLRVIPSGIQHHSSFTSTLFQHPLLLWHNHQVSQTANSAARLVLNSAINNAESVTRPVKGSINVNYLDIIQQWNIPFNGKTPGPNYPGFSFRTI